jgi:hypothetical protein
MTIEYADLSKDGLIYHPRVVEAPAGTYLDDAIAYLDSDRDIPEIVGTIPNLREFAVGGDYNVGAFEIKAQDSRVVTLPANLEFLLPTTRLIMDDLYATAGSRVADQAQVSLQFFRRDYARAERLLFDQIHRHASEGKMVIYVATAVDSGGRGDPYALGWHASVGWQSRRCPVREEPNCTVPGRITALAQAQAH